MILYVFFGLTHANDINILGLRHICIMSICLISPGQPCASSRGNTGRTVLVLFNRH